MANIEDLKVVGMDESRPPLIRKEPYIDLPFRLSDKAPERWCDMFNTLTARIDPQVKINPKEGLFIETYVRDMDQIPATLKKLKEKVAETTETYLEEIRQKQLADAARGKSTPGDEGPQGRLNKIIESLNFD